MMKFKNGNIFLLLIILVNLTLFFTLDFIQVLEKTDKDILFYTKQLQDLLLNNPTYLMYPLHRIFIPAISILVSNLLQVSYIHAMQIISLAFLLILIVYIKYCFRKQGQKGLYLSVLILSLPVIMLYSASYFIEMPFFVILMISFWEWDKYCQKRSPGRLGMILVLLVIGVLIKEAVLFHVMIMMIYAMMFYGGRIKKLIPACIVVILTSVLVYYLNYDLLFNLKKQLILNGVEKNAITTNFEWLTLSRVAGYFIKIKGGFGHVVINLLLAFGLTHALVGYLLISVETHGKKYLTYFIILFIILNFIALQVNPAQKFAFLCFGPSLLLLVSKNLSVLKDRNIKKYLVINYVLNLLLISSYGIVKLWG